VDTVAPAANGVGVEQADLGGAVKQRDAAFAGYASAQGCTIPTDDEVQARTAKCLLSIDGKLLVNERCNLNVSPDEPRHHH